jgi:hypothetical protein
MDQPTHNIGVTPQAINDFCPITDHEMNEIVFGEESAKKDIEETMCKAPNDSPEIQGHGYRREGKR